MNIAFYGNFSSDTVNGVSVATYALAKTLVEAGHGIFFYYRADSATHQTDSAGIIKRSFLNRGNFLLPDGLHDFLIRNIDKIAIFHIHSVFYIPNSIFALTLSKLGYKYILTPHGGYLPNILARHGIMKRLFFLLIEKRMVNSALAVFCVSEKEKKDLLNIGYKGIIRTIPNIVSIDDIQIDTKNASKHNPKMKTILFLGRYDAMHKGLDNLLHIFKYVEAIDSSIRLCLYGQGKDKKLLCRMAKELHLKNISINDSVFGMNKLKIISEATVYIQPSRWEVFGVSVFEAALLGIPVVLTKHLYLADFFIENELGILIDDFEQAARQIVDFINDQSRLLRIKSVISQSVQRDFSPAVIRQLAENAYQELIDRTG